MSKLVIGTQADGTPATLGGFEMCYADGYSSEMHDRAAKEDIAKIVIRALAKKEKAARGGQKPKRRRGVIA